MKVYELLLSPEGNGFNPVDGALVESDEIQREKLVYLDAFDRKNGVFFYQLKGSAFATRSIVEQLSVIPNYSTIETANEELYLYCRFSFTHTGGILTKFSASHPIIFDEPVTFIDSRSARIVVAATQRAFQEAVEDAEEVGIEVLRTEPYSPSHRDFLDGLTERQREILERMMMDGYYSIPRQSIQDDIASEFDISAATVAEHIRRIETTLFPRLIK